MVERDVVLAKVAAIDRSLARIRDVRAGGKRQLLPIDVEDIVVLNLQRAAQAAIDLAAHVAATEAYGLPTDLADAFSMLERHGVIAAELAARLRKMVGFRNIAVHQYETLDPRVIDAIVEQRLGDFQLLADAVTKRFGVL
ncbi:MAG: DUF86 domain-containing protein [Myxococcales bacterium]|nr:DUF86 domain-containing protein [Myxococcales bacterium]